MVDSTVEDKPKTCATGSTGDPDPHWCTPNSYMLSHV